MWWYIAAASWCRDNFKLKDESILYHRAYTNINHSRVYFVHICFALFNFYYFYLNCKYSTFIILNFVLIAQPSVQDSGVQENRRRKETQLLNRRDRIKEIWVFKCLVIPKALKVSFPKTASIFLSGLKNCLFSGSWSLYGLFTISGRLNFSPFLPPAMVARSSDRVIGLVSPDPLGILTNMSVRWVE